MEVTLAVLIATMPSRERSFNELWRQLFKQLEHVNNVHVFDDSSIEYNIGTKRNKLLEKATSEYVVFIDDDDQISPNYISLILEACKSGADCIGISGIITTNGANQRQWHISKEYGSWYTGPDGVYYRTPNHISPVRRELALQAGFPEISFGEDAEYSRRLLPLLKSEVKIEQNIYHYKYNDKK